MSWFDAAGLANIAKSALKEAQKTIDKALDIKDDESILTPANTPIDPLSDDFFGNWGLAQPSTSQDKKHQTTVHPKQINVSNSIWGSFTGSFFENNQDGNKSPSITSLDDTLDGIETFSRSKLVVQNIEEVDNHISDIVEGEKGENTPDQDEVITVDTDLDNQNNTNTVKRREKQTTSKSNRLSVLSAESGKNSSESADIITCSTECTSPDSEMLSAGHSISTSSSALGLQPTSDSVEVLGDSLTSPSSVEVIGTDSTNSRRQSDYTDEVISPLSEDEKSSSVDKLSPDSVEVIPEDQDENSIAEDTMSYTSVSESTSATVLDSAFNPHLKPQKMLKDTFGLPETVNEINTDSDKKYPLVDAITRAPARSTMQLPLTQVLIDTQPQSIKQDLTNILQKTNIIDIPVEVEEHSITENPIDSYIQDDSSQSDKTITGSDNIMESSSDTSTATETSSNSTYLKNLLADAMTEKSVSNEPKMIMDSSQKSLTLSQVELIPRENSPISSESRSDLVKIGSDHTSGDELETTTSSDIEIISSPNGDSSSTQSRQSPAKQICTRAKMETEGLGKLTIKKIKSHNRELSEASSISDELHPPEVDKLLKKITEITEILESRESKLIDVNRRNAELQEVNNSLKVQLDTIISKQLESADLSQVTEEYTQRMSALEKKFQQAIREKDNLRKQLEQTKVESATRISKGELESLLSEKEGVIKELMQEGEKLSKQQLQHSNIIKKLRAKEKENENTIKHLKENVESLTTESDRLKKSLAAKDEVERTQIEAINQLTSKNKKLENEVNKLKGQLDDLTQKYDTVKKSLEAAKKELQEKIKTSSELQMREQLLNTLENQKKMTESQNSELVDQLEDLRQTLRRYEEDNVKNEEKFREDKNKLMRKLEEAEARNEELSQSVSEVSKPLIRQLESLQATHSLKLASFEKIEEELTLKITELQTKLQTATNNERIIKDDCIQLRSKFSDMESELNSLRHKLELSQMELQQQKTERFVNEQELNNRIEKLNISLKKCKETISEKENELCNLQQQFNAERAAFELEKRQIMSQERLPTENQVNRSSNGGSNSPTLSLGKVSVSDSMTGSFWSQDEPFEVTATPRYTNMFEMQMLQTSLKQRDGEVQQLQWELNRREQERNLLNNEISNLLTKVENLESKVTEFDSLKIKFDELEQQYDTLCQLYGEKVEQNEELKLDLEDVKDMYKSQIDELLRQQRERAK
ncbi:TATA element modulatory factor-like [Diorhabda carinulata]|uniref:TATA element modulatory factor-like n=1 Tax=Diorhabda carinulata TaxID=1163345 RepID=UPI0025A2C079|nr:TATA element modulatory factor-like [Diorhabda carinulata]